MSGKAVWNRYRGVRFHTASGSFLAGPLDLVPAWLCARIAAIPR